MSRELFMRDLFRKGAICYVIAKLIFLALIFLAGVSVIIAIVVHFIRKS